MDIKKQITKELDIKYKKVSNTIDLLSDGNTVPFISRYRKEVTGNLDENIIRDISDKLSFYNKLEERKEYILKTIDKQDKLTKELEKKINKTTDMNELEDLYLPYKPKKKTKASKAIDMGFEPLAKIIFNQEIEEGSKEKIVNKYKNEENNITEYEDVLKQARYIVSDYIKNDADLRKKIRQFYLANAVLSTEEKNIENDDKGVYKDYYDYKEPLKEIKSHRLLAINRAEKEKIIKVDTVVNEEDVLNIIKKYVVKNSSSLFIEELLEAVEFSYFGYIHSSIENDVRNHYTEKAESTAINVFEKNLQDMLMSPPASNKNIIGIDPGLRTGSKAAVIDKTGKYLDHFKMDTLSDHKIEENINKIKDMLEKYNVELIAVGNGKGSKDVINIISKLKKQINDFKVNMVVVNESGASIYSASKLAAKEFPELDVTIRGAISIARRIHDPLSEFVKIDPKSLGIGQYQHDVNQKELKRRLDSVVSSVVNKVGVDINSASIPLLSYVSGISGNRAESIVQYRNENERISSREELLNINGIGKKTFKQCAGFLRIRNGENILDNTAIHPEKYEVIQKICDDSEKSIENVVKNNEVEELKLDKYKDDIGKYTFQDVLVELKKPGRDIRDSFKPVPYSDEVSSIEDLQEGMVLVGSITNITNFGMFIDLGIGTNGLCHISNTLDKYVDDLNDHFSVGEWYHFEVEGVDLGRDRISLKLEKNAK